MLFTLMGLWTRIKSFGELYCSVLYWGIWQTCLSVYYYQPMLPMLELTISLFTWAFVLRYHVICAHTSRSVAGGLESQGSLRRLLFFSTWHRIRISCGRYWQKGSTWNSTVLINSWRVWEVTFPSHQYEIAQKRDGRRGDIIRQLSMHLAKLVRKLNV